MHQLRSPIGDLRLHLFFLVDGHQGLLNHFGAGLAKPPFTGTAEIVGSLEQAQQHAQLLRRGGVFAEIVLGQCHKAKFFVGCKFPGHVGFNLCGHGLTRFHELGGVGLVKRHQHMGGFHFHALAAVEFNLGGRFGLRQDPSGHEFATVFKECIHGADSPMMLR